VCQCDTNAGDDSFTAGKDLLMGTTDATVAALWRYPVKSMLGERLDTAVIGDRGLAGDRAYALIDVESGNVVSAKNPRRWARMFECRAEYVEPPELEREAPPVRITLPDGTVVRSDEPGIDDALTTALGRPVRLTTGAPDAPMIEDLAPDIEVIAADVRGTVSRGQIALLAPGTFFDAAPVHVVTTSSLAALAAANPASRFEPPRFRPNLVVETEGDGFVENAWVDHNLTAGRDVSLHLLMTVPRCVMTTLAQADLPADKGVLQTVARVNFIDIPGLGSNPAVGVYGLVTSGGEASVGEQISVAPRLG
jgi:uncharacterized protein